MPNLKQVERNQRLKNCRITGKNSESNTLLGIADNTRMTDRDGGGREVEQESILWPHYYDGEYWVRIKKSIKIGKHTFFSLSMPYLKALLSFI